MHAISSRINNFDLLRLVAALCVLVSHQYALSGMREPSVLDVESLGGFGVLVFFSISGFLVMQSWESDPVVWRFVARRLLRIWPGLAVVILLTALLLGPLISTFSVHDYFVHPALREYFKNLRFDLRDELPMRFSGNALPTAINGSLWTIPLELKCYAALLLLGAAGLLRWRWFLLALTCIVGIAFSVADPRGDRLGNFFQWKIEQLYLIEFGLFFFSGAAFYAFRIHESVHKTKVVVLSCWVLAALALWNERPLLALLLIVPTTVLAVGNASTPYLRRAGRFGDISYGLYIYAFPVQQSMIWLFGDRLPWGVVLLLTMATTALLAFASWHSVEKRALRLKPRRSTINQSSDQVTQDFTSSA